MEGEAMQVGVLSKEVAEGADSAIAVMRSLIAKGHSLRCATSFGKDSLTTTILALRAIELEFEAGRNRVTHYVTSSSTGIENPAMEAHACATMEAMREWSAKKGLPVEFELVYPSLAAQMVVTTVGQGKLPRTPQTSKGARSCSVSWKVEPQQRLAKRIDAECRATTGMASVAILGTRFEESKVREAKMRDRGESAIEVVRDGAGYLTLSPIAEWTVDMVWEFLGSFATSAPAFECFDAGGRRVEAARDLYRDANEGACVVVLGEGGNKGPCGSRFGCSLCTVVGERDKSMDSMVANERYAHLRGLAALRNYLVAVTADTSRRDVFGRTVSEAGYVALRPDTFSYEERLRLLRMMLTIDAVEAERAERLTEAVDLGEVEATEELLDLCEPQFRLVSHEQIVAIDFYLSMHHEATTAFPALMVWHDVHVLGRRYAVPEGFSASTTELSSKDETRWVKVSGYTEDAPSVGLRSFATEMWGPYLEEPIRGRGQTSSGEPVCHFEEASQLMVDAEKADVLLLTFGSMRTEAGLMGAEETARFYLSSKIIRVGKGHIGSYQEMARRGEYWRAVMERYNLDGKGLVAWARARSISNSQHTEVREREGAMRDADQAELFAA